LGGDFAWVPRSNGDVFRGKLIRESDRGCQIIDKNQAGIFQSEAKLFWAPGKAELPVHGIRDIFQQTR
jgi:hypothetical protein